LNLALAMAALFVWQQTIAVIRRRAKKTGATEIKNVVRLREDPWCQAYISRGMLLNCRLPALALVFKRTSSA
jgi:hypothetical protein